MGRGRLPSNAVILEYPDGTCKISTPPPTAQVLEEYEEAIRNKPDDAQLRRFYSSALDHSGDSEAAVGQLRVAVSLQPDCPDLRCALAMQLEKTGDMDGAIPEFREALRLREAAQVLEEQCEALTRWGLSHALLSKGRTAEAREELERAVTLVTAGVEKRCASEQLLNRLKRELESYG
jgi:tetratricopeptide (TPR) repeat protein